MRETLAFGLAASAGLNGGLGLRALLLLWRLGYLRMKGSGAVDRKGGCLPIKALVALVHWGIETGVGPIVDWMAPERDGCPL